jgi:hypothetical protein
MRITFICILVLSSFSNISAQEKNNKSEQIAPYETWIYTYSKTSPVSYGILYDVQEDSLHLTKDYLSSSPLLKTSVNNIHAVILRKKGKRIESLGNGAMIGGLVGIAAGVILGKKSKDCLFVVSDCMKESKAFKGMIGGLIGAAGGAIVGLVVGNTTITIPINRDTDKYKAEQARLKSFAILK